MCDVKPLSGLVASTAPHKGPERQRARQHQHRTQPPPPYHVHKTGTASRARSPSSPHFYPRRSVIERLPCLPDGSGPHEKGVAPSVDYRVFGAGVLFQSGGERRTSPGAAPQYMGRGSGYQIRSIFRDNPPDVRRVYIVTWEACWPPIGL
jgi:hypothetical protein